MNKRIFSIKLFVLYVIGLGFDCFSVV